MSLPYLICSEDFRGIIEEKKYIFRLNGFFGINYNSLEFVSSSIYIGLDLDFRLNSTWQVGMICEWARLIECSKIYILLNGQQFYVFINSYIFDKTLVLLFFVRFYYWWTYMKGPLPGGVGKWVFS